MYIVFFFFSSRRRHTRWPRDWSSDVCSSDLRVAIEHIDEAALRDLCDGWDASSVARDVDEIGRGGEIAIPQVVMHRLEVPAPLSGRGIEREQRVREQIGAEAAAAVEVG